MSNVTINHVEDLERMRKFGAYEERERIIAILELEKDDCSHWTAIKHDWPADHDATCERCRPLNKAIARIKGEDK
jgi:hypothetical protein